LTDTSLYIYICVKHFGVANIKFAPSTYLTASALHVAWLPCSTLHTSYGKSHFFWDPPFHGCQFETIFIHL